MPQSRPLLLFGVALLACCLSGCQMMVQQPATTSLPSETIPVQIRPAYGKVKQIDVVLEPNMRLQDVIEASKVKFRSKLVHIVRTSPLTGQTHKLEAEFGARRRVSLETDYAIQPGDKVVIAQDTRSSMERVMLEVLGRT